MKNCNLLLISMATLLAIACNNPAKQQAGPAIDTSAGKRDTSYGSTHDLVDKTTASRWIKAYDSVWNTISPDTTYRTNFFTVRTQDVVWSMGVDTSWRHVANDSNLHPFMRITFGYDAGTKQIKAFFQPVANVVTNKKGQIIAAGIPLYFDKHGKIKIHNHDSTGTSHSITDEPGDYVADLNTPCPPMCNQDIK